MRHLTNDFLRLRKKGKVAFGRKSGGFHAGAVVMFRIDDDGIIQEARKLEEAERNNIKVESTCSYADKLLDK